MNRYAHIDCPICGKPLDDGSAVVVCPDCGAPYHLECYKINQQCIFQDLHEKNEEWKPPIKETFDSKFDGHSEFRCSRCGTLNPPEGIFCQVCGNRLSDQTEENDNLKQPFGQMPPFGGGFTPPGMPLNPFISPFGGVSPDEEIDGVAAKDLAIFVGRNSHYFLPRFKYLASSKGKITTVNWAAFFFSGIYFLYRKMYGIGILLILINIFCSIPDVISAIAMINSIGTLDTTIVNTDSLTTIGLITSLISMSVRLFCGFMANKLYKKHTYKKIAKIKEETQGQSEEVYVKTLTQKGSVAVKLLFTLLMIYLVGSFVLTFIALPYI
ncbi:RING finger protein [Paludicola sp. MB14-C6]|uniref:RING finger protein n=1 Tax=Paludihabitans sp. MB14-C6 TaxID=3070656 RepID=UPI0027DD5BD0|nr:RING finger protein [Paludicola sp. MB14-C6]WMJ22792.1 RING finger protein [Paludicola sp. MB14-C6]